MSTVTNRFKIRIKYDAWIFRVTLFRKDIFEISYLGLLHARHELSTLLNQGNSGLKYYICLNIKDMCEIKF